MKTATSSIPAATSHLDADPTQAVLRADDARHAAMVAHDLPKLSALLGDDLVYTHSTGRRESKAQYLNSLVNGRVRYVELKRQDSQLDVYGTTVVMNGSSTIRAITQGEVKAVSNLFQSVWSFSDLGWQMVAWTSVLAPSSAFELDQSVAPVPADVSSEVAT